MGDFVDKAVAWTELAIKNAELARLRAENENHAQRIDAMHAIWRTHKCNVDGRRSVGECVDGEMCGCSCALFIPREPVTAGDAQEGK